MFRLFSFLLWSANSSDGKWQGHVIKRGQLITGRKQLSSDTGISERSIRTCLARLEDGGEISQKSTNKFTIITICKYEEYQAKDNHDRPATDQQPTSNRPATDHKQEVKEVKEVKNNTYSAQVNCPHDEIIKLYHEILPSLIKVQIWNDSRRGYLRARWREDKKRQNLKWWETFFQGISSSDFLMGRVNGFQADLEWIVRPKNFAKIIEGKYNNRKSSMSPGQKTAQALAEWAAS